MRGEKVSIDKYVCKPAGSPPRARGKVDEQCKALMIVGITPACAGKSSLIYFNTPIFWDHPRVRGEKFLSIFAELSILGSPPRARGKVLVHMIYGSHSGITPACAGKSLGLHLRYSE